MNKSTFKMGAVMMVAIVGAGLLMANFPTAPVIGDARRGYAGGA